MGLFDRFRKPKAVDRDGNLQRIVVMEEKDTIYAPTPGMPSALPGADGGDESSEGVDGIAVVPSVGGLWAPQTGNVSFDAENGTLSLSNYLGVDVVVRLSHPANAKAVALSPLVEEDAHVHVGDPIATFDLDALKEASSDGEAKVVLLVSNADDFAGVQPATDEAVEVGDDLLRVLRK